MPQDRGRQVTVSRWLLTSIKSTKTVGDKTYEYDSYWIKLFLHVNKEIAKESGGSYVVIYLKDRGKIIAVPYSRFPGDLTCDEVREILDSITLQSFRGIGISSEEVVRKLRERRTKCEGKERGGSEEEEANNVSEGREDAGQGL